MTLHKHTEKQQRMVDKEDKYKDEEEELTQVRSIIKHLNEENPSRESSREVVVRADGSKVVRVRKKRRVMLSARDVQRRGRKRMVQGSLILLFMLAALVFVLFYRMSVMSSSAYLADSQVELQQRWGAESIRVEGAGLEGTKLHLEILEAKFPESCMIERVELFGVSADVELSSFFVNRLKGDELKVERALLVLRHGASMQMPKQQGESMWRFRRVNCNSLTVQFQNEKEGPLQIRNAQAYMYYPHANQFTNVVMLSSGVLDIKGWKAVNITESKVMLSADGIEDFSLKGTTDSASDVPEQRRTRISFAGRIAPGASFAGPYSVESDNMSLADFTKGRFEEFLTARTSAQSQGKISDKATITLAVEQEEPTFNGEFHLRNICLSAFPALQAITEHIEPARRRLYNPLTMQRGYVVLREQDGELSLEIPAAGMEERDLASLKGKIVLNPANELTGELHYGIPMLLARAEYPDGRPDPIFQQHGDWAILQTRVSGVGTLPADDMAEVEARAAIARRERPARIPFHELNLDKLTEQLKAGKELEIFDTPAGDGRGQQKPSSSNPFEMEEDPFAPTTPF